MIPNISIFSLNITSFISIVLLKLLDSPPSMLQCPIPRFLELFWSFKIKFCPIWELNYFENDDCNHEAKSAAQYQPRANGIPVTHTL